MNYVLYHGGCYDGFCAAWLLNKYFEEIRQEAAYFPVQYGEIFPDEVMNLAKPDDPIWIVDFCYPRDVLDKLFEKFQNVKIIDHHKTAKKHLESLDENQKVLFDEDNSGGMLVWRYIYGGNFRTPPWLVAYTEDRDLWKWKLPFSREINAAIRSYPMTFEVWNELDFYKGVPEKIIEEGRAIRRLEDQIVNKLVLTADAVKFEGHNIAVVGTNLYISEVGDKLDGFYPFAMMYFVKSDGKVVVSLRSRKLDVSEIAVKYGGGGHKFAAGFQVESFPKFLSMLGAV